MTLTGKKILKLRYRKQIIKSGESVGRTKKVSEPLVFRYKALNVIG